MRCLLPATDRDRGATIPIVALLLPVLILMVAFAVDLGMQRSNRRTMQARADIIALDMARLADGRQQFEILADSNYTRVLNGSKARNDVPADAVVEVFYGIWSVGSPFVVANPTDVPNAARVVTTFTQDYFFQPGSGTVTRSAVAAYGEPIVDLTVGSVGAGFHPTIPNSVGLSATVQALNARLAAQFGASIPNPGSAGFDLAGYRGLAAADVDLGRVASNAGFASPNELMASDITVGQFFSATAAALDQQAAEGDPNAATAAAELRRFQTQMGVDNTAEMRLGDTIDFEQGGDDNAANTSMNVLDLVSGGAEVINGQNFVSYQFAPGIPGVAVTSVDSYLVSKATRKTGGVGTVARNKQMRIRFVLQIAPLAGMTSPIRIPLVIEAATAQGVVDDLACSDPLADSEAGIGVDTSGLSARIGTTADLEADELVIQRGVIIGGGGLTVSALLSMGLNLAQILGLNLGAETTGSASVALLGGHTDMVFTPYVDPAEFQRAPGGLGAFTLGSQLSSSLTADLANGPLGLTVATALVNRLGFVFNNLDTLVIDPLLASSGVTIAGADVLADNLICEGTTGLKLVG